MDAVAEEPGTVIGPYKLLEQIGEGGFGIVYMADQQAPVRRRVALKIIKPGMDTRQVLARFKAELQALSLMDHPNIARVLDAGATDSGRPYFVMELIRGVPITEYCDKNKLPVHERLELFVQVCHAVQHAHQKGIIHRDIKPSNVLVTLNEGRPMPKVIDFGVAKALNPQLTQDTVFTRFAEMIGTPLYMSPEQAEMTSLDIDTRADIYSLGVLLYELLTGSTPFEKDRLRHAAYDEIRRIIREEEPPKPSLRISSLGDTRTAVGAHRQIDSQRLSQLVQGDLDWIVMKALEKDRTHRYDTASNFAADVLRYLSDQPVEARPPSAVYRFGKFARRNRVALTTGVLVCLALIVGTGVSTWQAIRAVRAERLAEANERKATEAADAERRAREQESQQRAKAEQARDRTRQVLDAMTSTVTEDSLSTQKEISPDQKKFLTEVLKYYQEFAGEKGDDEASRARTAAAAFRVGMIEHRLGRNEQAVVAFQKALGGLATLSTDFPARPEYRNKLASCHDSLGNALDELGKSSEALEESRKAVAIREKLAADFPKVPMYRSDLCIHLNNLGNHLDRLGKYSEAKAEQRKAITIQEKLAADYPAEPEYRRVLAFSYGSIGYSLLALGQPSEAEQEYRKALAIYEKLAADFPKVPEYRSQLAEWFNKLGLSLQQLGKGSEAEQENRRALAICEKLAADFPAVPRYRMLLANSYHGLGVSLWAVDKFPESEREDRKALTIQESLAADFPTVPEYRMLLATSYHNLGVSLWAVDKFPEAEREYRKALTIRESLAADYPAVPRHRMELAHLYRNLGVTLKELGKRSEAGELYRKAVDIQEKLVADHPTVPRYQSNLADGRTVLAGWRVDGGQITEAIAEVTELAKSSNLNANNWYEFACVYARAGGKSPQKKREYTDRAMECLNKAVRAGFRDAREMKRETALDSLRDRDDFKKLLAELTGSDRPSAARATNATQQKQKNNGR